MDGPIDFRLILASASPRRVQLLRQIGFSFEVIPARIEEQAIQCVRPSVLAERLALAKARAVSSGQRGDAFVIGADTVVVSHGRVLGKPRDEAEAAAMLRRLSGSWHRVITGLAVVSVRDGCHRVGHEVTAVQFAPMTDRQIQDYIDTGDPMDKAGAYGIQGMAGRYIPRIRGCYYNVMGLPLHRLCAMLGEMGFPPAL